MYVFRCFDFLNLSFNVRDIEICDMSVCMLCPCNLRTNPFHRLILSILTVRKWLLSDDLQTK